MPKRDGRALAGVLATEAAGDEAAPARLLEDANVPDEVVAFHAQQAVEKCLKSVLAEFEVAFERTHTEAYLLRLLADNAVPPAAVRGRVESAHALGDRLPVRGFLRPHDRSRAHRRVGARGTRLGWERPEAGEMTIDENGAAMATAVSAPSSDSNRGPVRTASGRTLCPFGASKRSLR